MNNQPCIVEIETDRHLGQPEISEEQIQDALGGMQEDVSFVSLWIEAYFGPQFDALLYRLLNDPAADLKALQDDARAMFNSDMRQFAEKMANAFDNAGLY